MNYRDFLQKVIYAIINPTYQGDDCSRYYS